MNISTSNNVLTAVFKVDSGIEEGFERGKEKPVAAAEDNLGDVFEKTAERPRPVRALPVVHEEVKVPSPETMPPVIEEPKVEVIRRPVYSEKNYTVIGTVVDAQGRSIRIVKDRTTNEIIQIGE